LELSRPYRTTAAAVPSQPARLLRILPYYWALTHNIRTNLLCELRTRNLPLSLRRYSFTPGPRLLPTSPTPQYRDR